MTLAATTPLAFDRIHAVFFALIAADGVLLAGISGPAALDIARFILLAAAAPAGAILRRKNPRLVVSPFFLLAIFTLVFFSLLPWAIARAPLAFAGVVTALPELAGRSYIGTAADRFVIAFSALCLTCAVIAANWIRMPTFRPLLPGPRAIVAVSALIALLSAAWVVSLAFLSPTIWWEKQILDAFNPIIASLAALAFLDALAHGKTRAAGILLMLLGLFIVLFFFLGSIKPGLYLVAAMAILLAFAFESWRRAAIAFGIFAILMGAVFANFFELRYPTADRRMQNFGAHHIPSKTEAIVNKAVTRQVETGHCLNKIIDLVAAEGSRGVSPYYFLGGLVPRLLWQDKPEFSSLGSFAAEFCFGNTAPGASFSMTLLGEPLLLAGKTGVTIAAIFFFVVHGLILVAAARAGPAGAVALLALAPWLIDFDQFLSLHWGNALKMLLYMSPVLAAVAVLAKRAPKSPAPPDPIKIGAR